MNLQQKIIACWTIASQLHCPVVKEAAFCNPSGVGAPGWRLSQSNPAAGYLYHPAVDLSQKTNARHPDSTDHLGKNTPIFAMHTGRCYVLPGLKAHGNVVVIVDSKTELVSVYSHLNSISVSNQATVQAGSIIGTMGHSGMKSKVSHLHVEVSISDAVIDLVGLNLVKVVSSYDYRRGSTLPTWLASNKAVNGAYKGFKGAGDVLVSHSQHSSPLKKLGSQVIPWALGFAYRDSDTRDLNWGAEPSQPSQSNQSSNANPTNTQASKTSNLHPVVDKRTLGTSSTGFSTGNRDRDASLIPFLNALANYKLSGSLLPDRMIVFLAATCARESGWMRSKLARESFNAFGVHKVSNRPQTRAVNDNGSNVGFAIFKDWNDQIKWFIEESPYGSEIIKSRLTLREATALKGCMGYYESTTADISAAAITEGRTFRDYVSSLGSGSESPILSDGSASVKPRIWHGNCETIHTEGGSETSQTSIGIARVSMKEAKSVAKVISVNGVEYIRTPLDLKRAMFAYIKLETANSLGRIKNLAHWNSRIIDIQLYSNCFIGDKNGNLLGPCPYGPVTPDSSLSPGENLTPPITASTFPTLTRDNSNNNNVAPVSGVRNDISKSSFNGSLSELEDLFIRNKLL